MKVRTIQFFLASMFFVLDGRRPVSPSSVIALCALGWRAAKAADS